MRNHLVGEHAGVFVNLDGVDGDGGEVGEDGAAEGVGEREVDALDDEGCALGIERGDFHLELGAVGGPGRVERDLGCRHGDWKFAWTRNPEHKEAPRDTPRGILDPGFVRRICSEFLDPGRQTFDEMTSSNGTQEETDRAPLGEQCASRQRPWTPAHASGSLSGARTGSGARSAARPAVSTRAR